MTTPIERIDGWVAPPAPAERLAAMRILAGTFSVVYLVVRAPELIDLARQPEGRFAPVGVLAPFDRTPSTTIVWLALAIAVGSGLAFTAGWRHRVFGPLHALTWLVVGTFHSSWGQLLHFENLLVLHLLILGFSPAADAWTLPRRSPPTSPGPRYGWPLRLAALATVVTYVLAGLAKLRIGGIDWMTGDTLQNHVAYAAARLDLLGGTPAPLAEISIELGWLLPWLATATVAIELGAPIALTGRRAAAVWSVLAVAMHLAILATMAIFFAYQALGLAFAPFFRLERIAELRRPLRSESHEPLPR